ncbi:hypothetical protein MPSEU_000660600 [Mayamaea pseudoterrestris]|nr:hypothetical protein MPSEU_000660600 [Mayamaea pseudoterrestris]
MTSSAKNFDFQSTLTVAQKNFDFQPPSAAFAPSARPSFGTRVLAGASSNEHEHDNYFLDRRQAFRTAVSTVAAVTFASKIPLSFGPSSLSFAANAATIQTVVVAGATGQTGRRILERLASQSSLKVIGGVRNVDKATQALSESSTVVRGAMVQNVAAVSSSANVSLKKLDVAKDSVDDMATTSLAGADALIIAVGFVPGNPLKMNQAAHEVDNVGTCKLIDAAKQAGVKKIVMVSSILTNARAIGKASSPGFIVTNAFGNVLDEKLVAENHLKASGIDYTIVRPGGLKAKPPTGDLRIYGEDALEAGEISRDYVADVCVGALTDPKASNKVLEIIEEDGTTPRVFNGLNM